jgi:uncharacterized protein YndB with AHSA1/START domain
MENNKEGLTIIRKINAPKEMVFNAFAEAEALAQWWGPKGMPVTVEKLDFKPNGIFHYKMEGNGQVMWGIFHYKNIVEPDLIEFVSSFSDENGNICKAPFPIDFPLEIFNQFTLEEADGVTTLTLQGHPVNATADQEKTYRSMFASMQHGFSGTFDQLDAYLETLK